MNQLIIYISLLFCALSIYQGDSGFYYISGKGYNNAGEQIRNERITIFLRFEKQEILIDSLGNYEAKIPWESTCPSGRTDEERTRINKMLNIDSLQFKYRDTRVKIENEWKKYARLFPNDKDEVTNHINLYFE